MAGKSRLVRGWKGLAPRGPTELLHQPRAGVVGLLRLVGSCWCGLSPTVSGQRWGTW